MKRLVWGLLLAGCTTIVYDPGGLVEDYINLPPSVISGYCASACTMRMKNGCITESAILMFHGPSYWGLPLSERDFNYWSEIISSHYPPELRDWYMSTGRYTTTEMNYEELLSYGVRSCNARD